MNISISSTVADLTHSRMFAAALVAFAALTLAAPQAAHARAQSPESIALKAGFTRNELGPYRFIVQAFTGNGFTFAAPRPRFEYRLMTRFRHCVNRIEPGAAGKIHRVRVFESIDGHERVEARWAISVRGLKHSPYPMAEAVPVSGAAVSADGMTGAVEQPQPQTADIGPHPSVALDSCLARMADPRGQYPDDPTSYVDETAPIVRPAGAMWSFGFDTAPTWLENVRL